MEDLPRVHIMEDEDGRLHMRNLSLHTVASEEEALNLVWLLSLLQYGLWLQGAIHMYILLHGLLPRELP